MNRTKLFYWFLILFLGSRAAYAQHNDSLAFAGATWKIDTLGKQALLYRYHFEDSSLFGAKQYISFVKVAPHKKGRFKMAANPVQLLAPSGFVKGRNARVAVNGNFFDMKNGGSVDFTRVGGKTINENRESKAGKRDFHQKAAVVIKRGKIAIKKWDGTEDWEHRKLRAKNVMLNGPLLIFDHQLQILDSNAFNNNRHPRTCVGITESGATVLLVTDGRNRQAAGMSLSELTKIMRWLGCKDAINFDGGGSSTLWVDGLGVVNHPSDNQQWDHEGERKVANILYLQKN